MRAQRELDALTLDAEHAGLLAGTANGLADFDPVAEKFRAYDKPDGLPAFGVDRWTRIGIDGRVGMAAVQRARRAAARTRSGPCSDRARTGPWRCSGCGTATRVAAARRARARPAATPAAG